MRIPILGFVIASLFMLTASGCQEYDQSRIVNLKVYGHAGAGLKPEQYNFPGNSLEGIKKAIMADGADGVEIDVQMSRDSVVFLFHDERLEGNTNGIGTIHESYSVDLLDMYYRKSYLGTQKHSLIPLSQLIDWMNDNKLTSGLSINIQSQSVDSFQDRFNQTMVNKILTETTRLNVGSDVYIESPIQSQLNYLVSLNRSEHVMWDTDLTLRNVELALVLNYDGIVSSFSNSDVESVNKARENGIISVLFGLRIYPNMREALKLAPDIVQTDNVALTISLRDD
jgi:glycerophosphoryl diester phosphodiesterase